jgi:hypothetical protein
MFKPLEIVGDSAVRTTDQKVRGSNPFERAEINDYAFAKRPQKYWTFRTTYRTYRKTFLNSLNLPRSPPIFRD